jgi:cytochrome oxidase Cu insertion factor (SCO1/SenC/PrrC family)
MQKTYTLTRHRWIALWMILIFTLPILVAHLLYTFRHTLAIKTAHHGELVSPALDSKTLGCADYSGKWQLIYIRPQHCDFHCEQQFQLLKNVHIALGKDQERVVSYSLSPPQASQLTPLWQEHTIWVIDPQGWFIMQYPSPAKNAKGILEDMRRLLRFSHVG